MRIPDPFQVRQTKLVSGGQAYWQHYPRCGYAVLGVAVKTGSMNDPFGKAGTAHLLEHMLFDGTEKYLNNLRLSGAIESLGGITNGFTSGNMTSLLVVMPAWHIKRGWDIIEQMLFCPLLSAGSLKRQVKDVVQEIAGSNNNVPSDDDLVNIHLHLFGTDCLTGSATLGSPQTLSGIGLEDIRGFHRRYYTPANMNFIACGNLGYLGRSWPSFLDHRLGRYPSGQNFPWRNCEFDPRVRPTTFVKHGPPESPARVLLSGRLLATGHPPQAAMRKAHHAIALAQYILIDAGQTSILFQELRQKRNLAYEFSSDLTALTPTARYWMADVTTATLSDAERILDIIRWAVTTPGNFGQPQLEAARRGKLGRIALADPSPHDAFGWVIRFLPEDGPIPRQNEWWQNYARLTAEDLQEAVARDLSPQHWVKIKYYPV